MIIVSHRGYWLEPEDKNSLGAFERSFMMGYGTETDLRDHNSNIVISHDPPYGKLLSLEIFFEVYKRYNTPLPLALNIKSDGLQAELFKLLDAYQIENYFVFDMSVPDGLMYAKQRFRTYTRQSEYEQEPSYYSLAQGVWLDEFKGHWISDAVIETHLLNQKHICIVSPELHKREYRLEWKHYRELEVRIGKDRLMLCTDYPKAAHEYFND